MSYKKLGIFVATPVPGGGEWLTPPLTPGEAEGLYRTFLADLFVRFTRLKKASLTVFVTGPYPDALSDLVRPGVSVARQEGTALGERLEDAFRALLAGDGAPACVIGSTGPDLPLAYVKRAFVQLKHRDVVLGPAVGGGCYLVGLKRSVPGLFREIDSDSGVFRDTARAAESRGLSLGLLPPWYDVGGMDSLSFLETMLIARRIAGGDRLPRVEQALSGIRERIRAR